MCCRSSHLYVAAVEREKYAVVSCENTMLTFPNTTAHTVHATYTTRGPTDYQRKELAHLPHQPSAHSALHNALHVLHALHEDSRNPAPPAGTQ